MRRVIRTGCPGFTSGRAGGARALVALAVGVTVISVAACGARPADQALIPQPPTVVSEVVQLPQPTVAPSSSFNDVLDSRHSVRSFTTEALSQEDLAAVLWAAYGARSDGGRTAPSAGGLYALTIFVAIGDVSGLEPGVYVWDPAVNQLGPMDEGDPRLALQAAALDQASVGTAPATVVIAGSPTRLAERYGARAERFALNEAGHAAQNALLMATALDLGAVAVGGFRDDDVTELLNLPKGEHPYYLTPLGHPAQ